MLAEERPGDLMLAWEALERRGTGWTKRALAGLGAIKRMNPAAYEKTRETLPALKARRIRT
jgi:hypothetical protein